MPNRLAYWQTQKAGYNQVLHRWLEKLTFNWWFTDGHFTQDILKNCLVYLVKVGVPRPMPQGNSPTDP